MHWWHLFDAYHETGYYDEKFGIPAFTRLTPEFVAENIDRIFPTLKSKMEYLKGKFLDAKQQRTLYVVSEKIISSGTLLRLKSSLTNLRGGDTNFMILYVPAIAGEEIDPCSGIVQYPIPMLGDIWTQINHEEWKKILSLFSFVPGIWD